MTNPSKPTFFVSTPIYYVNAMPHLGTAYSTTACDTIARWKRMDGFDTFFLTGVDEHGQKVAESAVAHGMTPQAWVDSIAPGFQETWKALNISNDDFIRTTDERHVRGVQKFLQLLYDKGYLYKGSYEGWYCVHEETYYAESDLEKNEEGEFVCPDCKRPVQKASGEENWFFKLSEFQDQLLAYYDEHPDFICPDTRRNEVLSFVRGGLKDLSISRTTFDWGIPLPFDKGHVTYVWFDALLNYITAIGYGGTPEEEAHFERFWPADVHMVGKDIIRFHCVIWPAMLMAAGLPLPKKVFAHGFLLTKGEKMSKSKGNAVSPQDLCAVFGVDAYRYYFMSDVQIGNDGSISLERMVQVYNSDLANRWGNLCSRVFNMCGKYFDGKVPQFPESQATAPNPLKDMAAGLYTRYRDCMDAIDYSGAMAAVGELCTRANLYVEESAPWNLAKSPETSDQLAAVIYNSLEAIRIMACFYAPFMPATSAEALRRLGLQDPAAIDDIQEVSSWGGLPAGNAVDKGEALFPRLNIDDIHLGDM